MYRVRVGIVPRFFQTQEIESYFIEVTEEERIELLCFSWIDVVNKLTPRIPEDHFLVAMYEFEEIEA